MRKLACILFLGAFIGPVMSQDYQEEPLVQRSIWNIVYEQFIAQPSAPEPVFLPEEDEELDLSPWNLFLGSVCVGVTACFSEMPLDFMALGFME